MRSSTSRPLAWSTIPFQEGGEQIEPQQQIDEPDVVVAAPVQQAPPDTPEEKGGGGHSMHPPGHRSGSTGPGGPPGGDAAAVEGSHLKGAGVPQEQEAAEHEEKRDAGAAEGVQQQAEIPGGRPHQGGVGEQGAAAWRVTTIRMARQRSRSSSAIRRGGPEGEDRGQSIDGSSFLVAYVPIIARRRGKAKGGAAAPVDERQSFFL